MSVLKLKTVVFPNTVNVFGKSVNSLEMGENSRPVVMSLEYNDEKQMVMAEVEGKGMALFPIAQVANLVPMPEKDAFVYRKKTPEERAREAYVDMTPRPTPPDNQPNHSPVSVEEAERIRAEFKARHMTRGETTPFPDKYQMSAIPQSTLPKEPPSKADVLVEVLNTPVEDAQEEKPKPKKRGRPKKKKNA